MGPALDPVQPRRPLRLEFPQESYTSPALDVRNTTSHDAFMPQELVPSIELSRGHHTYYVRIDPTALGGAPSLGVFTPGLTREYTATTTARVISSAMDTALSVTGVKLADNGHSLEKPLDVRADGPFTPLVGSVALKSWTAPVVAEAVELGFRQAIADTEALRTGAYTSTLTFTVSTTQPWTADSVARGSPTGRSSK